MSTLSIISIPTTKIEGLRLTAASDNGKIKENFSKWSREIDEKWLYIRELGP